MQKLGKSHIPQTANWRRMILPSSLALNSIFLDLLTVQASSGDVNIKTIKIDGKNQSHESLVAIIGNVLI